MYAPCAALRETKKGFKVGMMPQITKRNRNTTHSEGIGSLVAREKPCSTASQNVLENNAVKEPLQLGVSAERDPFLLNKKSEKLEKGGNVVLMVKNHGVRKQSGESPPS